MESFEDQRHKLEARGQDILQDASDRIERGREIVRHPVENVEQALAHQRPDGVIGDWKLVAPEDQNVFQRIANDTHGIVTPGSAVTVLGGIMSTIGLNHYRRGRPVKATLFMFIGRMLDVADGEIAARTGTRGAPGALLDATVDKALSAAFVVCAVERGDITRSEAMTHAFQQARSAVENTRLKMAGGEPNPSRAGKWGQAMLWLEAGGIVSTQATEQHDTLSQLTQLLKDGTELVKHGAMILNEQAALEYTNQRRQHETNQSN